MTRMLREGLRRAAWLLAVVLAVGTSLVTLVMLKVFTHTAASVQTRAWPLWLFAILPWGALLALRVRLGSRSSQTADGGTD